MAGVTSVGTRNNKLLFAAWGIDLYNLIYSLSSRSCNSEMTVAGTCLSFQAFLQELSRLKRGCWQSTLAKRGKQLKIPLVIHTAPWCISLPLTCRVSERSILWLSCQATILFHGLQNGYFDHFPLPGIPVCWPQTDEPLDVILRVNFHFQKSSNSVNIHEIILNSHWA